MVVYLAILTWAHKRDSVTNTIRSAITAEIARDAWNGHSRSLKVIRCCAGRRDI